MERTSSVTITVNEPKKPDEVANLKSDVRELKSTPDVEPDALTVRRPPPLQSVRVARAHKAESTSGVPDPLAEELTPSIHKTIMGASVAPGPRSAVVHPPRNPRPATAPPGWAPEPPHPSLDEVALLQDQVAHLAEERSHGRTRILVVVASGLLVVGAVGYLLGAQNQGAASKARLTELPVPSTTEAARVPTLEAQLKLKNEQLAMALAERDALRARPTPAASSKAPSPSAKVWVAKAAAAKPAALLAAHPAPQAAASEGALAEEALVEGAPVHGQAAATEPGLGTADSSASEEAKSSDAAPSLRTESQTTDSAADAPLSPPSAASEAKSPPAVPDSVEPAGTP
jgi:hypothetical protein